MTEIQRHHTASWAIDLIGGGLIVMLVAAAWRLAHPLTPLSVLPLAAVLIAAGRIFYELTWNRYKVPTVATGFTARRLMARALREAERETVDARNGRPFKIVDMGSGRGELTRFLARALPNSLVEGVEIAPLPHAQAVWMQRHFGPANLSYRCADFDSYDCVDADAVVMYLSGALTLHVGEKLARALRPGATVIAHTFPLGPAWPDGQEVIFHTPFKERIFIYRKK